MIVARLRGSHRGFGGDVRDYGTGAGPGFVEIVYILKLGGVSGLKRKLSHDSKHMLMFMV